MLAIHHDLPAPNGAEKLPGPPACQVFDFEMEICTMQTGARIERELKAAEASADPAEIPDVKKRLVYARQLPDVRERPNERRGKQSRSCI